MALPNDINSHRFINRSVLGTGEQTLNLQGATPFDPLNINVFNQAMEKQLKAIKRQAQFLTQPFTTVANTPQLLRQKENRTYFLIQNTGANTVFIGFDFQPTAVNGLNLAAGAFAEPFQVPTNDIWLNCTLATTGILIFAIGND